uniref:Uncharacterized protein n=1 Tax=Oryza glaberrima TaxID=4538 RepID=A0A679BB25_ORYGL|nr:hypothetical protein [Oryza glaberrima]
MGRMRKGEVRRNLEGSRASWTTTRFLHPYALTHLDGKEVAMEFVNTPDIVVAAH